MPTTNSVPRGQKYAKGPGTEPEPSRNAGKTDGFRTPMPRVLARFPDLDAKDETIGMPAETLPGLERRVVSRKFATRFLVGVAVVLVLMAVLPVMFQRKGGTSDSEGSASSKPSWQPENPAPDASVAPAWDGAARQVGDAAAPSGNSPMEPSPILDYREPLQGADTPPAGDLATEPVGQPGGQVDGRLGQAALANQEQSLSAAEQSARRSYRSEPSESPANAEAPYETENLTLNRASAIPESQVPAAGYREGYQAGLSGPSYQQGYGTGAYAEQSGGYGAAGPDNGRAADVAAYQESAPAYQPYRGASSGGSPREAGHRPADVDSPSTRGYTGASQAPYGTSSDYRDYRQAPTSDYGQPATNGYRQSPVDDYRQPATRDYRQMPTSDYRQDSTSNYRQPLQAADARFVPAPGYPTQPYRPNYRETQQNEAPPQQYDGGYRQEPGSYPATGYQNSNGAGVVPARGAAYYQADRRNEAADGNAPYGGQPGEPYFRGTIEQAPVNSGSRLY